MYNGFDWGFYLYYCNGSSNPSFVKSKMISTGRDGNIRIIVKDMSSTKVDCLNFPHFLNELSSFVQINFPKNDYMEYIQPDAIFEDRKGLPFTIKRVGLTNGEIFVVKKENPNCMIPLKDFIGNYSPKSS